MRIPLMRNAFLKETETKVALADFILHAERLSMDKKCREFEQAFANYQKRTDAILFNSGGSANLALIQVLKNLGRLKEGCKIGFSGLTWSTNVMPIIQLGFTPVAIDCNLSTLNVSSSTLLARLQEVEIDAFFLTNVLGFVDDIQEIKRICEEREIILIEDNCESLGTKVDGILAGNFSLASTFSFFVAHHMSTIEGGMICTDDEELGEMLRITRANGWDRNLTEAQQKKWRNKFGVNTQFRANYSFFDLGYNLRPTEITGFLGLYQMQFLEENISRRESNYLEMEQLILENKDMLLLKHDHIEVLSTFAFPFIFKSEQLLDKYLVRFAKASIETRPIIAGNMQTQPFYKKYIREVYALPNTEYIHHCGLYIGNYPELTLEDLALIKDCLI